VLEETEHFCGCGQQKVAKIVHSGDAIAGLDLAVEALYPHTDFYKMGRTFFQRTIEGNLQPEQEEKLRMRSCLLPNRSRESKCSW
jgi:hypothetical protein